jgi:nitrate reductase NapE component
MDNDTPQPNNAPPANNEEPVSQTPSPTAGFGNRVIQPLDPNLKVDSTPTQPSAQPVSVMPTNPLQETPVNTDTQATNSVTQPTQPASSPSSIYPEPHVSSPSSSISQASIEKEEKQSKKRKRLIVLAVCLVAILLVGVGGFYYWYSQQDHSVYAKLTTENYNQDDISFSFQYPAVMSVSTKALAANKDTKAAYQYESGATKLGIIMGAIPFSAILQQFNITPTQELTQLQTGQGNFANAIKTANPSVFSTDYGNCNWLTTNSGQKDLICTHQESSDGGNTVIIVIGADDNYQYGLTLGITNNIYSAHQKVWQKIEKSFNY